MLTRRRGLFGSLALTAAWPAAGLAQPAYPNKPIRIVHGYGPGSNPDIIARVISPSLMSTLGQSVIVEPKPGAGERIAAQYLTTQPPDGYTLYLITGGANVISATDPQVTFSTLKDFSYISTITLFPVRPVRRGERALQDVEGFHRRGPRAARQAQLRPCRHRQHAASRRRAPEGAHRHPDRAGRLQGPGAADQRRDRGPPRRLDQHLHQLPQRAQQPARRARCA